MKVTQTMRVRNTGSTNTPITPSPPNNAKQMELHLRNYDEVRQTFSIVIVLHNISVGRNYNWKCKDGKH